MQKKIISIIMAIVPVLIICVSKQVLFTINNDTFSTFNLYPYYIAYVIVYIVVGLLILLWLYLLNKQNDRKLSQSTIILSGIFCLICFALLFIQGYPNLFHAIFVSLDLLLIWFGLMIGSLIWIIRKK